MLYFMICVILKCPLLVDGWGVLAIKFLNFCGSRTWPEAHHLVNLHGCATIAVALAKRRRPNHTDKAPWSKGCRNQEVEP